MAYIVITAILGGVLALWALTCIVRRLWETELVQSRVLRWTGHSYYVPTSWMHDRPTFRSGTHHSAAFQVTFAAVWGSLVGSCTAGTRRTPARASAPAARNTSPRAADSIVRPDCTLPIRAPQVRADTRAALPHPIPGQGGPQLTATAGEDPNRPAVAVHHLARAL